jgi:hypothetical protein
MATRSRLEVVHQRELPMECTRAPVGSSAKMTPRAHRFALAAALATIVRLLVGVEVNPTEVPTCFGQLWPGCASYQAQLHMAHRIGLGVWTVVTLKALPPVELHLGVGALLLAATTILAVACPGSYFESKDAAARSMSQVASPTACTG